MTRLGRPNRPARPWLGLYATETENKVVVIGVATRGPAKQAGVEAGDIVLAVAGRQLGHWQASSEKIMPKCTVRVGGSLTKPQRFACVARHGAKI
jgi:predicted metalloprotease with PDZ domain